MTEPILLALVAIVALAAGMALQWWLSSRPTTTKAEAYKALAAELVLIQRLPGAADARAHADMQAATEAVHAQALAAAMAQLSAPVVPSAAPAA
jgi:flagellar basal body-associated protein FliL